MMIAMKCPICKKLVEESTADKPQTAYPFCSERCKLIDLGCWLDGKYQVTVADDNANESAIESPDDPSVL